MHLRNSLLQEQCCVKQDREGEGRKLARPRIHCNFVLLKAINKRTLGSGGAGSTAVAETDCSVGVASQKGQGSRMM